MTDRRSTPDASTPTPEQRPAEGQSKEAPVGIDPRYVDSNGLPTAYRDQPDSQVWDDETGETFGEARERFATFGTEVPDAEVPALLRAGHTVWSFGYGDDPEGFTTIDLDDLDNGADDVDLYGWGPFRLDPMTPVVPEATAKRVIVTTLAIQSTRTGQTFGEQALAILEALRVAGVTVEEPLPYDREGTGHMFQTMCASCLNEPLDVEDIDGPCPEREGASS